ncbi:MAG: c-type cytochrome [Hyphomicrobiales bacterium]|nr:c-type cytochrome [Hyphomicrobiales bacterium]MCP5371190.1 c-type cytochrome [Hyphomicrobiales bacterium]
MSGVPAPALALVLCLAAGAALAAGPPDPKLGAEIYEICAPCHGLQGQGGGGGVYPRLAGLPADYLSEQLRDFKRRVRTNIPMLPYATDRELPDEDIAHVAAYLNGLTLATRPPPADDTMDGLARLNQMKSVLQIPRAPGDAAAGGALYARDCARCHGKDGYGHEKAPGLAGQHVPYLVKQVRLFLNADREHRDADQLFGELEDGQVADLMAYLSTLDD